MTQEIKKSKKFVRHARSQSSNYTTTESTLSTQRVSGFEPKILFYTPDQVGIDFEQAKNLYKLCLPEFCYRKS